MKLSKVFLIITIFLSACGDDENSKEVTQAPTKKEMDQITLAYIQEQGARKGAASCGDIEYQRRRYVSCRYISLDGNTGAEIWLYDQEHDSVKRFYALNGTAMASLDKPAFQRNLILASYAEEFGLPLPEDMNISAIRDAFPKYY